MATVQQLAVELARLAEDFGPGLPDLLQLRAAPREHDEPDRVVVLARNQHGKSSILDMVVLSNLPTAYAPEVQEQQQVPLLLEAQLDGETVAQALESKRFVRQFKPDTLQEPGHLQRAYGSLHGYYHGVRDGIGKCTVILPVGNIDKATTVVEMRIGFDTRPGCTIHVRSSKQLYGITSEAMEAMLEQARDAGDKPVKTVLADDDFTHHADLFKLLTNIDIKGSLKKMTRIEAVIERLEKLQQNHDKLPGLLHDRLHNFVNLLKPAVFLGTGNDLSSDLFYIKQKLRSPMSSLLEANDMEPPQDLCLDELVTAIVHHIDVTVPCDILANLTLVDVPGLDDDNPLAYLSISKALNNAQHVLAVVARSLDNEKHLLRYITQSSWLTQQMPECGGHGRLVVLRYLEKHQPNIPLKEIWDGDYINSAKATSKKCKKLLLSKLEESFDENEAKEFVSERTHVITTFIATSCSLGLARAKDVYDKLKEAGVSPDQNLTHLGAMLHLEERTHMAEFLDILASLARPSDQRQASKLKIEVDRIRGAIEDRLNTIEQAKPVTMAHVDLLKGWTRPYVPSTMVNNVKEGQFGAKLPVFEGPTSGRSIINQLRHELNALQDALIQAFGKSLEAGNIAKMACTFMDELNSCNPNMHRLRRLCLNRKLAVDHVVDVVGRLVARFLYPAIQTLNAQKGAIDERHRAAAHQLSELFQLTLEGQLDDRHPELLDAMQPDWDQQVTKRISAELDESWHARLLTTGPKGDSLYAGLVAAVRGLIWGKLRRVGGDREVKNAADLKQSMEGAIIDALGDVKRGLPVTISKLLDDYKDFVVSSLFRQVRNKTHRIVRNEAVQPQVNDDGHAAVGTDAGPGCNLPLAPCLWRSIYRFFIYLINKGMHQQDDNAVAICQQVVARLQEASGGLQAIMQLPPAKAATNGLDNEHAVGTSLVHSAQQRARISQVLHGSIQPAGFKVVVRDVLCPQRTLFNLEGFIMSSGVLDFPPAWTASDALPDPEGSLQHMFNILAAYSLYPRPDCVPPFQPGCALEAARACMKGSLLAPGEQQKAIAMLRQIVASEQHRDSLADAGIQRDVQDPSQWAGLLELSYLARALQRNLIVFSARASPYSGTGRLSAFYIPFSRFRGGPGARDNVAMYPMAVVMRKTRAASSGAGRVRPRFIPLFKDPARHLQAASSYGSSVSFRDWIDGISPSLNGSDEEFQRVLSDMADRAARRSSLGAGTPPVPSKRPRLK